MSASSMMRSRSSRGRVRRALGLVVEAMMVLVISIVEGSLVKCVCIWLWNGWRRFGITAGQDCERRCMVEKKKSSTAEQSERE